MPSKRIVADAAKGQSLKANAKEESPVAAKSSTVTVRSAASVAVPAATSSSNGTGIFYPKNSLTVIGTYHSVLAGIVLRGSKFKLKFSTKHHVGCINSVAVCEKFIATSGTDERIFLFTCKDRGAHCSDLGSLTPPAEVTCLAFPGNSSSYLACGCGDGSLLVYKTREWDCQFHLPNLHEKAIRAFAFHPMGGRVGVTVGADRTVALLNMVAGKLVSKTRLPVYVPTTTPSTANGDDIPQGAILAAASGSSVPLSVQFSAGSGELIFITMPLVVYVFHSMTFTLVCKIELPTVNPDNQICSSCVVGERTIVVGCENGQIRSATVVEDVYKAYLTACVTAAEEKSKPSLASLAVKAPPAKDEDQDDEEDDEEDVDDDSNSYASSEDDAEVEAAAAPPRGTKSAFAKPNLPADTGRVAHIPDSDGPYLQTSKKLALKASEKKAKDEKEKERRAKQAQDEAAIPRMRFSAPLVLAVPSDVEESQKHIPYQHKRKNPTAHGARVRSIVCQDPSFRFDVVKPVSAKDTKAALGKKRVRMDDEAVVVASDASRASFPGVPTDCVLISADTEGCVIAWRVALKPHAENVTDTNTPIAALHYVGSCNCSGRVTQIASLMQE